MHWRYDGSTWNRSTVPLGVNKTAEADATKSMMERVEDKFDLKPERLVGDTNYGTAATLGWLVDEKQTEEANEYCCPEGKALRCDWRAFKNPRTRITKADTIEYRSSQFDCVGCPTKSRCCPTTSTRKITRSIHEKARDVVRALTATEAYAQSRKDRKKVEMLFAHLKRILKLDKLRLRGFSGAQDKFLLAATAQNLRRMAKWLMPTAPEANLMPT